MKSFPSQKAYYVVRQCTPRKDSGWYEEGWYDEGCYNSIKEARAAAKKEKRNNPSCKFQVWKEVITISVKESL